MDQTTKGFEKEMKTYKDILEDDSGKHLKSILSIFKGAKNKAEFDVMYVELSKDTRIGKMFKQMNDTAKKTLIDKLNKMKK